MNCGEKPFLTHESRCQQCTGCSGTGCIPADGTKTIYNATSTSAKTYITRAPTIKTQRTWIKQVFSNLLSNGLKFNNSKNPKICIKYEEKEDTHLFSVTDNGIGIEKRHEEKIFSLFQRLHTQEEYPGSGAGLTICKKIVESLGGEIWFESEIDKGTTFFFTLLKENTKPENIEDHQNISDQMKDIHNLLQ